MNTNQDYSLQTSNSFNINSISPKIYFPSSLANLQQLVELEAMTTLPFYILGEGSNTLFVDQIAPVIIKPNFHGISVEETAEYFIVTVGASENWHQLVCFCLERGINGLENLALIPGSVGAAPVQNIGAYGVEFADFCQQVDYFDLVNKQMVTLTASQCLFSYRDSIFKQALHNSGIITQVVLSFPKKWQANFSYHGLDNLNESSSATEIMLQVIRLRQSKLPDPKSLPNAGSFFKNPVICNREFRELKKKHPQIPHYPQATGEIKLAAGWLIEQAGLKGIRYGAVGVHSQQALVLVNYQQGTGSDMVSLAKYIQRQVKRKFGIDINPEVRMITSQGEQAFIDLKDLTPIQELNND